MSAMPLTTGCHDDAEAAGELVSEGGLVDGAAGFGVGVGAFAVDGPPAVFGPHPVDDDDVGVDLGVVGSGGEVVEPGGDISVGFDGAGVHLAVAVVVAVPARRAGTGTHWSACSRRRRRPPGGGLRRRLGGSSSLPKANSSDTDFGAEKVRSKAATFDRCAGADRHGLSRRGCRGSSAGRTRSLSTGGAGVEVECVRGRIRSSGRAIGGRRSSRPGGPSPVSLHGRVFTDRVGELVGVVAGLGGDELADRLHRLRSPHPMMQLCAVGSLAWS